MTILRPTLALLVLMTVITGIAYPLFITGMAEILFPEQAAGSLIQKENKVVGSHLIGQNFTSEKYFHGRPSATTATDPSDPSKQIALPYNAAASGASYRGPTNKSLIADVKAASETLQAQTGRMVPVDLVTASASGLDPHISPAAALSQAPRIARARALPEPEILSLINQYTSFRLFGILGEPVVNVLELNLGLDTLSASKAP